MINLEGTLRQELVGFLSGIDILQTEDGRRAMLRDAGLKSLIPRIRLTGATSLAVGNIGDYLAQWGTVEGQEALFLFLSALLNEVGGEGQKALHAFMEALGYHQKGMPDIGAAERPTPPDQLLEKMIGEPTLQPIRFLERALQLARSVAYIEVTTSSFIDKGTGFMLSPGLLLTNNHVLPTKTAAEQAAFQFNYQQTLQGDLGPVKTYRVKKDGVFHTDADLDYTIVELADTPGEEWGFIPLSAGASVHRDDRVNIIQHPDGRPKQISFRNNFVEYVDGRVLQYVTHTERGSSGSPVFNDRWELVALHHAGGIIREPNTQRRYYRNEGIIVKAILGSLPQNVTSALDIA
ncbi:MAG TPA: serine protease [Chloroflexi bacterium]|nr:serine protease [Chloroflexota bacterium]